MGVLFTINDDAYSFTKQGLDDIIEEFGKPCRLVYPPLEEECTNCEYDPHGNKSANRWITGGPMPFTAGTPCPMCGGQGKKFVEQYDDVKMVVEWSIKNFVSLPGEIRLPYGAIQTFSYITLLPNILQAQYLIAQTNVAHMRQYRFKLLGEPADVGNIVQDRYLYANWERAG